MIETNPVIDPKYQFKHRVTGAFIIISLAVIIIPTLLSESTRQNENQQQTVIEALNAHTVTDLSQTQNTQMNSLRPALVGTPLPTSSSSVTRTSSSTKLESSQQVNLSTKSAIIMAPDRSNSSNDKKIADGLPNQAKSVAGYTLQNTKSTQQSIFSSVGWSVRVGTFVESKNAQNLTKLLNKNGFQVNHTKVKTKLGNATRLWLGPYRKFKTAKRASHKLKQLTGEEGYVFKISS